LFSEVFKENNNIAARFIENSLQLKRQIQGLILEGENPYVNYFFALETARVLNCREGALPNCQCVNCKWVRSGEHPAVTVVSPIDFKPSSDKSTTVISIEQTREIIQSLMVSSDYHRVFIFTDAKNEKSQGLENLALKGYEDYFPALGENWQPSFLSFKNFQEEASNSLLKILEEPPQGVSFIFLTKNKNDLISTIVSRAFSLSLSSNRLSWDYSFVGKIFSPYPNFTLQDVYSISDSLAKYVKENELSYDYILNSFEMWLGELLKSNLSAQSRIIRDLKLVSKAKQMIRAFVSPQNAVEYMLIEMMKNE